MAAASSSLRWCVRASRSNHSGLRFLAGLPSQTASAPRLTTHRGLSSTALRRRPDETPGADGAANDVPAGAMPGSERESGNEANIIRTSEQSIELLEKNARLARHTFYKGLAEDRPTQRQLKDSFWHEDEDDGDMLMGPMDDDEEFNEDDIMGMAHAKLEEHRELRAYQRIAIWEMPMLSKFARPFEKPDKKQPLRWRYTSYMGEFHPAEKKVVVEFSPKDLPLSKRQQDKLRKLVGTRLNPEKDVVKMSCESFEQPAQNKRYLGDLIAKLVAEARDSTDTFKDVPLDTRHHTFKVKPKFPKSWRVTEERRAQLDEMRKDFYDHDMEKKARGLLIDGKGEIQKSLGAPQVASAGASATSSLNEKIAEMVLAGRSKSATPSPRF